MVRDISIYGCGGTGSGVATLLSKMKHERLGRLFVYDHDFLDGNRISNDIFTTVHGHKVNALPEYTAQGLPIGRYTQDRPPIGLTILATDSFSSRKRIVTKFDHKEILDIRLGAEHAEFWYINPYSAKTAHVDQYLESLNRGDTNQSCNDVASIFVTSQVWVRALQMVKARLDGKRLPLVTILDIETSL